MPKKLPLRKTFWICSLPSSQLFRRSYVRFSAIARQLYRILKLNYHDGKDPYIKKIEGLFYDLRFQMKQDFKALTGTSRYETGQDRLLIAEVKPFVLTGLEVQWMRTLVLYDRLLYDLGKALAKDEIEFRQYKKFLFDHQGALKQMSAKIQQEMPDS